MDHGGRGHRRYLSAIVTNHLSRALLSHAPYSAIAEVAGVSATGLTAKTVRGMAEAGKTREFGDRVAEVLQAFLAG
jgi:hypothetical protein